MAEIPFIVSEISEKEINGKIVFFAKDDKSDWWFFDNVKYEWIKV